MSSTNQTMTTGPAAGGKKTTKAGKAARAISEVSIASDEKAADEARTAAPTVGAQAVLDGLAWAGRYRSRAGLSHGGSCESLYND